MKAYSWRAAAAVAGGVAAFGVGGVVARGEVGAITPETPWRVFLVCSQQDRHRKEPVTTYTQAPPAGWTQSDFDDSGWGRYSVDLDRAVGGYGFSQSATAALLCLRTRFGIDDPSRVSDLSLSLEYRGGVVVHVNGREVARQDLPQGPIEPQTPAAAYPPEAFKDAAGNPLPGSDRPAAENLDRYEQRIRRFNVAVPASVLRKGANALSIEVHAAPTEGMQVGRRMEWSTAGLCSAKLASASGSGVTAYADALKATGVWNATPMDTVAVTPGKYQSGFLWWGITVTPVGLTRGNPFEPLQPIRTVAPRGGTCSGQVVVSGPQSFKGLRATLGPLRHVRGGAAIPAGAVRVGYATQARDEMFCNALQPQPADGAAVQPVWVVVDVPRDQAPGWYAGTLTLTLDSRTTSVPVQVLVSAWTLTDPKDNATLVSLYQSPDTLAAYYKVPPWSDRHFTLIERSLESMAGMGNDVLLVPVVIDNYLTHTNGMVRWVRKGSGYEPEFSAFERYLDLQTKVVGKPKIVTLSLWKHDFGTRTWFRGMKSDTVKPCMVTELDPATGAMKPMQAPHFGEPGSEAFWRSMIEGVRRIVKARGCDDRFLLLGEAFDSRPLQSVVDFFTAIEPGMRWQIYSHFDGSEPPVKDGRFVSHGGFDVGFRINPNGGGLPEFERNYPKVATNSFYVAQAERTEIQHTSSPLSYRAVMRTSGTIARIGLDFWPMFEERGRLRSFYGCPPNEGWLWRGHVPALTAAGPDGAVRTTRGQMLLQSVQEAEVLVTLLRARQGATPEVAAKIGQCLGDRHQAAVVAKALSQATISLDWEGMAAREYALAAELAGAAGEGTWSEPPAGGQP